MQDAMQKRITVSRDWIIAAITTNSREADYNDALNWTHRVSVVTDIVRQETPIVHIGDAPL